MTALSSRKRKGLTSWINQENTAGYIFSLPFIIGFLMFMVIPMALSLFYSFCKYDIQNAPEWIGLDNYIKILTDDSTFTKSLTVTCYYALIGTPLKVIFALIVALILNHESKVVPIYRATYYLPSIIGGSVAVAILWRRLFEANGTINAVLGQILPFLNGYNWFSEGPAIWVLIILAIWLLHAHFPRSPEADSAGALRSFPCGRRQRPAAILEGDASAANTHHFLQSGTADHQFLPGFHPVQTYYQRRPQKIHAVLHSLSV